MESALVIEGATVLTGPDLKPRPDASIVVEAGVITSIGSKDEIEVPRDARTLDASGLVLSPGFIDAHVHIFFHSPADVLAGGVTTVRDLAWPPDDIFPVVEESRSTSFDGPQVLAAGPMITAPDGYPTSAGWAPDGTGHPVSTPEEARAAVDEAHSRGAAVIKVALNPPAGPTLSAELLSAVVEAAHDHGLKVTGHVYGLDELAKAIAAGVDELAHMLMSTEEIPDAMLEEMVAADMAIVPTLSIRYESDRALAIDNMRRFIEAGGSVIYGTDLGNAGPGPGIDALETQAMAEAGMEPPDIIRSATVDAARWLDLDDAGVLAPGMRADIVGFAEGALTDVGALSDPQLVVRGGRIVRGG
jgi:imidazolonepropionase-like amidohydrolase